MSTVVFFSQRTIIKHYMSSYLQLQLSVVINTYNRVLILSVSVQYNRSTVVRTCVLVELWILHQKNVRQRKKQNTSHSSTTVVVHSTHILRYNDTLSSTCNILRLVKVDATLFRCCLCMVQVHLVQLLLVQLRGNASHHTLQTTTTTRSIRAYIL